MNGILGFADVLHAEDLTADQLRYVDIIESSGNDLLTLINDILNLSQIEAGKLSVQSKLFNLRDTVIDATTLLQTKAKEKNLHLATHIDPKLPTNVTGDPDRVRQVLINLVGNAVKFTETGSVAVIVVPGKDGGINFSVVDTGCGIAEDKLDVLFDRFSQVDNSSTREFEGSGLGLAICSELVQLMDGEIGVKSQPGVGSEFWMTLPLSSAEELDVTAESMENRLAMTARVLVVDNVSVNQQIYRLIMPAMNAETIIVEDADAALAAVDQSQQNNAPFDLVIVSDAFTADPSLDLPKTIRERMAGGVKLVLSSPRTYDPSALAKMGFDARIEQPISARTIFSRFAALLPDNVVRESGAKQHAVQSDTQIEVSEVLGHVFTQSGSRAAG
jgi:CheY-like chemotaxis protein